jgi:hypothetical protein
MDFPRCFRVKLIAASNACGYPSPQTLVGGRPPIPFDRTTNCAAARPADASRAWTFLTLSMLFSVWPGPFSGAELKVNVLLSLSMVVQTDSSQTCIMIKYLLL